MDRDPPVQINPKPDKARTATAVEGGQPLIWDAHVCLPLLPGQSMEGLARHREAGAAYVSVNVGMDFNPVPQILRVIAGFRSWIKSHSDHYIIAKSVADIERAAQQGKLAVGFDLEGSAMLAGDLNMLGLYRDLGVNQIHLAYNRDNDVAGGCHGSETGLTPFGRKVVAEINRLGMIMDCSHSSYRTSMEVMALSTRPVIFSHSNPRMLCDHSRNIWDDQIDACAKTDGVVALSGIGAFVGRDDPTVEDLVPHIDYVVQRVGPRHVGLGLDYAYDGEGSDKPAGFEPAEWWPQEHYPGGIRGMVAPEALAAIGDRLADRGYSDENVRDILGRNLMRVATATWQET